MVMNIVLLLFLISTASLNMLIPSYSTIIDEFTIPESLIYLPDSLSVLVTAFVMVLWGYYTDKIDRNKVINWGVILSVFGFVFTSLCTNFLQLLIARIITGAGMGFAIPVAISVLSDIVLPEERSGLFGFLAIFSSISNGIGQGISAFLGPLNIFGFGWQITPLILSFLALIAVFQLLFVNLPDVGAKEESLANIHEFEEVGYEYKINQRQLVKLIQKPSNKFLILNGFFSIIPGTIIIFSLITTFSREMLYVLPENIRTQVSTLMAGVASFGYIIGSIVLSWYGDVLYKKNKKNRARLAFISNIIAIPLCILMIFELKPISLNHLPLYPDPIPTEEIIKYVLLTVSAIFQNYPNYIFYMIFSFFGTFFSAGMVINKNAVMVDVNLPEHRGTASSFFQLTEQVGKSVTLMLTSFLLSIVITYQRLLYVSLIFWIPSALLWLLTVKAITKDIDEKNRVLRERQQMTLIDYIFEINIEIDRAIQTVHDAKNKIVKEPQNALKMIDKAILHLTQIAENASRQKIADLESHSQNLLDRAKLFRDNLKELLELQKFGDLPYLYQLIDETWEKSDFGKIEVLYESGYLKVVEARLNRYYNPIECIEILQDAINIFDKVIRLASDRVVEEGIKRLTKDEEELQQRIHNLIILAQKSKSNTEVLKDKLNSIIHSLLREDLTMKQLQSVIALTSEYGLKLQDIIEESFDKRILRRFQRAMNQINNLFRAYDEWQTRE
ncbi:MFS transporter [Candidatus Harpocratesius sp.]